MRDGAEAGGVGDRVEFLVGGSENEGGVQCGGVEVGEMDML